MKKYFILLLLLKLFTSSFVNCGNQVQTLEVETLDLIKPVKNPTSCGNRNVCWVSCTEFFKGKNCQGMSYALEITDSKLFKKACSKREKDNDPLNNYIRGLKFNGSPVPKQVESILRKYLILIRKKDWCTEEGKQSYNAEQSKLIAEFNKKDQKNEKKVSEEIGKKTAKKQSKTRITKLMNGNKKAKLSDRVKKIEKEKTISHAKTLTGDVSSLIAKSKSELLKKYRDLQLSDRQCKCANILKYKFKGSELTKKIQELKNKLKSFCSNAPQKCQITENKKIGGGNVITKTISKVKGALSRKGKTSKSNSRTSHQRKKSNKRSSHKNSKKRKNKRKNKSEKRSQNENNENLSENSSEDTSNSKRSSINSFVSSENSSETISNEEPSYKVISKKRSFRSKYKSNSNSKDITIIINNNN